MSRFPLFVFAVATSLFTAQHGHALTKRSDTIRVAVTLPYLADVAREIGGEAVEVSTLVRPGIDPHQIQTTPALALQVASADLLIENGMQLEAWIPRLVAAANNESLAPGGDRHLFATNGLRAREIPTPQEIEEGLHVHPAGNPHIWLDPLNLKGIAENVEQGLARVSPERAEEWAERRIQFQARIDKAFFGSELVALVGGRTLEKLHRAGRLISFLEGKEFRDRKLIDLLGGWLARARSIPDREIFAYHSTWTYFAATFGFEVVATLEEKPGIPPGPAHLEKLSKLADERGVQRVVSPPYYPRARIEGFAQRIGAPLSLLPTQPGEEGSQNLFEMIDVILERLESRP